MQHSGRPIKQRGGKLLRYSDGARTQGLRKITITDKESRGIAQHGVGFEC
jgi:hypothetical protein